MLNDELNDLNFKVMQKRVLLIVLIVCICNSLYAQDVINVKNYGAVGDGKIDDYGALLSAVNNVNKKGGGNVFFPKGIYYIASYHTKDNKISDLQFKNCDGIIIKGDNAIILVNGSFNRSTDYTTGSRALPYSRTNAIIPMEFVNCNNIQIEGIEINGGVAGMSRDNGVVESEGHLIRLIECSNVVLKNLYLHHAQTDGITITGKNGPCVNVRMYNTISEHNARLGMSVISLTGGEFVNSKFRRSGVTGKYGAHAPAAGVDIEPEKLRGGKKTSALRFLNCVFEDNQGGQFLCTAPDFTTGVTLVNCKVRAGSSKSAFAMILAAGNVVVDSCDIDCGNGNIYPCWQNLTGSDTEIRNSTIKSAASGIMAITNYQQNSVSIHNNKIICTSDTPIKSYFPYLRMTNLSFTNNNVFIKSSAMKPKDATSVIENGKLFTGNVFQSDNNRKPMISTKGMLKVSQ